jgi:archaellum component FlaG (FlaF/FlaG flagellin family)
MHKVCLLIVLLLLFSCNVNAVDQIIINSEDWRDVYSGMLYGSLTSTSSGFLVSDKHSTLILGNIPRGSSIRAISSSSEPFFIGYESVLISRGYDGTEDIYENINLELASELDIAKFVIVDDSYGYNAISVAPYAVVSNSFVLFADKNNIRAVERFLSEREVEEVIIYGHVDREVRDALNEYSPEIIDKEGDRFANNVEIVRKYLEINPAKQVLLTNGEFIEKEVMSGAEPVVFIGANNVPDQVRDFIQKSDIEVGVLVGNELVGTATYIRRNVGISVFVKFAQGARQPKGAIAQVEALDMFYLPVYNLNIDLDSIRYNRATNQLEVNIKNTQEQAVYFKGTYTLRPEEGERQPVGDIDPIFLDGNELKTVVYDVEPMQDGKITADVYIIYGESKGSMEKVVDLSVEVSTVEIFDSCEIELQSLTYDKGKETFTLTIKNIGDTDCYVDSEILDLSIDGVPTSFSADDVVTIKEGRKKKQKIKAEMTEEDIEENNMITVRSYYGEREDSLIKVHQKDFELEFADGDFIFYALLVVIVVLLLLILLKRRKDKERSEKF